MTPAYAANERGIALVAVLATVPDLRDLSLGNIVDALRAVDD